VRPYARVSVDGRDVGSTPMRPLSLDGGLHTVSLVHPDFQPFVRKVRILPGETTSLVVDLALDAIPKTPNSPEVKP
jgi:serine/threonine-protein kinase